MMPADDKAQSKSGVRPATDAKSDVIKLAAAEQSAASEARSDTNMELVT